MRGVDWGNSSIFDAVCRRDELAYDRVSRGHHGRGVRFAPLKDGPLTVLGFGLKRSSALRAWVEHRACVGMSGVCNGKRDTGSERGPGGSA